jgi:hypothetical protein
MNNRGTFNVAREIFAHPLFASKEPFCRLKAWLWIISEAAWKGRTVTPMPGVAVTLDRGEMAVSLRYLASRFMWEKTRVERFLDRLESESMIVRRPGLGVTVLRVVNYDLYQATGPRQYRDTDATASATQTATPTSDRSACEAVLFDSAVAAIHAVDRNLPRPSKANGKRSAHRVAMPRSIEGVASSVSGNCRPARRIAEHASEPSAGQNTADFGTFSRSLDANPPDLPETSSDPAKHQ